MRLVLVVIITAVAVQACQALPGYGFMSLPGLGQYHEECAKESGVTITAYYIKGPQHRRPSNMEPTHEIKCFKKCLLEKGGYLNKTGFIILPDKLAQSFNASACMQKAVEDKCEMAYQAERCLMKQMHTGAKMPRGNQLNQIYEHRNTCIAELKLNLNQSSPQNTPMNMEANNETKCLQKCMLEKSGYIDKDGKIQEDVWPHRVGTVSQECQQIKDADKCQEVHLKNLCMMELNGRPGFMAAVKVYEVAQHKNKCLSELKLNVTNYPLFRPPSPPGRGFSEPSDKVKCLERCIMVKAGYMSEVNELVEKKWNLNDDVDVDRCTSIEEEDECEESYLIRQCIQEEKMARWREQHRQRNMYHYN